VVLSKVQARRSRVVQDAALPQVLWDKHACRQQALVVSQQAQPPPQEEPPKAFALDSLLTQCLPQAEPRVLSCRRVLRRNRPEDLSEVGLDVH
jgi:hypothetical protein